MSQNPRCDGCGEPLKLDDELHRPLRPANAILHDNARCLALHIAKAEAASDTSPNPIRRPTPE